MEEKHIVFIDSCGRNIVGKLVSETDTTVTVNNPTILHVEPPKPNSGNSNFTMNSIPLFFFEFIDEGSRDSNNWTFSKLTIVQSDVKLNEKIVSMYSQINTPKPKPEDNPKVININD